jgi:hypothetical protein
MRETIIIFDENLLQKTNKSTFEIYKKEAIKKFMHEESMVIIDSKINIV